MIWANFLVFFAQSPLGLNALLSLKPRGLFISFAFSLNRRWALTLCCCYSRKGSSFLCPNKETKQRNSPAAAPELKNLCISLNEKNSLRSNSFSFLTGNARFFFTLFHGGRKQTRVMAFHYFTFLYGDRKSTP